MKKDKDKTAEPRIILDGVPVFCAFDEIADTAQLKPHPQNPNTHPESQIALLGRVIRQTGWRAPITVSKLSGYLIKGHGRLLAAKAEGMKKVPVEYQEFKSTDEELAALVADNRIAELAEIDQAMLSDIFKGIDTDEIPIELTGYTAEQIGELEKALQGIEDDGTGLDAEKYTDKTDVPQYEVTGKAVTLTECVDKDRADEFLREIEAAKGLTAEELDFLKLAATRFYAFNYKNVAEYYANHASPAMQRQMEKMALVIIDFDDAIKNGYVVLSKDLKAAMKNDDEN